MDTVSGHLPRNRTVAITPDLTPGQRKSKVPIMWTPQEARAMSRRGAEASRLARSAQQPADSYVSRRLVRVRAQIAMLDAMIERETDAAKLDRLASAVDRLAKQEAALAMRPGPGQLRPTSPRPSRSAVSMPTMSPSTSPAISPPTPAQPEPPAKS